MKAFHSLRLLFACLLATIVSCGGASPAPSPVETTVQSDEPSASTPVRPRRVVEHLGPLTAEPTSYDCGPMSEFSRCSFDVRLQNPTPSYIEIERLSQDVSIYAQLGLVEDQSGLSRDLPYRMSPDESLRVLFNYRRDDLEECGGTVFVDYSAGAQRHRLGIQVDVQNP